MRTKVVSEIKTHYELQVENHQLHRVLAYLVGVYGEAAKGDKTAFLDIPKEQLGHPTRSCVKISSPNNDTVRVTISLENESTTKYETVCLNCDETIYARALDPNRWYHKKTGNVKCLGSSTIARPH